jgi:hypothetical protein
MKTPISSPPSEKISRVFVPPGILLLSVSVCMLSTLHPFSNGLPWIDSAVFLTIGQKMHEGSIPYTELFDHKGPFLYLINYLGLFFGWTGVWLCEIAAMIVSVSFAYKTARLWINPLPAFIGTSFLFLQLHEFFSMGNMPEEYTMALIFVSLFFYAKHWLSPAEWTRKEIFILGLCFGLSLMLKANLFGLWIGSSAVLLFQAFRKKDFQFARRYLVWFALGAGTAVAPFLIGLAAKGALYAYIEQNFLFNAKYATHSSGMGRYSKNFLLTLRHPYVCLVTIGTLLMARGKKRNDAPLYAAALLSLLLSIALFSSTSYLGKHYFMMLIPLSAPILFFCIQKFSEHFTRSLMNGIVGLALIGVVIYIPIQRFGEAVGKTFNPSLLTYNSYTKEKLARVREFITEREKENDFAIVLGSNCNLYFCTKSAHASKYIYQWPVAEIAPEIATAFENDVETRKPRWIFLAWPYVRVSQNLEIDSDKMRKTFPKVFNLLKTEYTRAYTENGLTVVFERTMKKELDNPPENHN